MDFKSKSHFYFFLPSKLGLEDQSDAVLCLEDPGVLDYIKDPDGCTVSERKRPDDFGGSRKHERHEQSFTHSNDLSYKC